LEYTEEREDFLLMTFRSVLEKAGVVKPQEGGWDMSTFVNTEVAQLQ
jgi:hypothetical protein